VLAMQLNKQKQALVPVQLATPKPSEHQVLIKISACGVCRTDLHIVDGELTKPKLPLILGHEIIGTVEGKGNAVKNLQVGDRVGVPWLGHTDGTCFFCRHDQENLCDHQLFTGYTINGGYAQFTVADADYVFHIPKNYSDQQAAPLMCAGLIGWRSYTMTGDSPRLGLYGFGAAAHIIAQIAVADKRRVYAFTRDGDTRGQHFARSQGAAWAGGSSEIPPEPLDAAIIFAPVGSLVPTALKALRKGGIVVLGGIHMSEIPAFSYDLLWGERSIKSVANLTRQDGVNLFAKLANCHVQTVTSSYLLTEANQALDDLRAGKLEGAAVLDCH
jgi:alcohol dehydrogenase, propanol-preferring